MSYKADRTSEDIKREIVGIMREIKDPRVAGKFLTVVKVDVSSDASYAKVYVSDIKGMDSTKEAVKGLTSAQGYIRQRMGKSLHLKKAPELKFIADDSVEHGMEIIGILDDLIGDDNEN